MSNWNGEVSGNLEFSLDVVRNSYMLEKKKQDFRHFNLGTVSMTFRNNYKNALTITVFLIHSPVRNL